MSWKMRFSGLLILAGSMPLAWAGQTPAAPQPQPTARPEPPIRDPHSPGYVHATDLTDGNVPSAGSEWKLHHWADSHPGPGNDGAGLDAWQRG